MLDRYQFLITPTISSKITSSFLIDSRSTFGSKRLFLQVINSNHSHYILNFRYFHKNFDSSQNWQKSDFIFGPITISINQALMFYWIIISKSSSECKNLQMCLANISFLPVNAMVEQGSNFGTWAIEPTSPCDRLQNCIWLTTRVKIQFF